MKFKSIEQIIKSDKAIILTENEECQWIGNGRAMFPLHDFPKLDANNIFSVLDIPLSQREKFYYAHPEIDDTKLFADNYPGELLAEKSTIVITGDEGSFNVVFASGRGFFINARYLKPFADMDNYELWFRLDSKDTEYIVAKQGGLVIGFITPLRLKDKMAAELRRFAKLTGGTK